MWGMSRTGAAQAVRGTWATCPGGAAAGALVVGSRIRGKRLQAKAGSGDASRAQQGEAGVAQVTGGRAKRQVGVTGGGQRGAAAQRTTTGTRGAGKQEGVDGGRGGTSAEQKSGKESTPGLWSKRRGQVEVASVVDFLR